MECGRADNPFPWMAADSDPIPAREVMREEMVLILNQWRRTPKAGGRLLDGRVHDEWPS